MAISIPQSVFTTYNEAVTLFERTAKLVYPEKKETCSNCYLDTMGTRTRSVSLYRSGGPAPFDRGMPCPLCNGKGYKMIETTEEISLRIYWERKSWVDVGIPLDFPQGSIQTIANMTDLPKIDKAKYLIPTEYGNIASYHTMKFTRSGASFPQGFKQNPTKYVVTFWERN
jgi:hypothetical protein